MRSSAIPEFFPYGQREISWLTSRDPLLGRAISKYGLIRRPVLPDFFQGISHAIIGQQISNLAQTAIWRRVREDVAPWTAASVLAAGSQRLRHCGLSASKTGAILAVAQALADGRLNSAQMAQLSDEQIAASLTAYKGIGPWTAEMVLIFTFLRPDVFSVRDLGLRKGLTRLHGSQAASRFGHYARLYSPFGTVASFYLWEIARE